ncbi:MAG: sensor histidine kinase [Acidimicrobiales bacterium]
MRRWLAPAAVTAVGAGAALGVAAAVDTPMAGDTAEILFTAWWPALCVGAAGCAALWALRRRPVQVQTAVVALVSVASVAAGVVAASASMFLSPHDRDVLFVVLVASGAVGALVALALGERVGRGAAALGSLTERIGEGLPTERGAPPPTSELARLAGQLEEMSARLAASASRERALDAARRELVAWVSHDLRTPLAGIRAMAEALEDRVVDDAETVARYHRAIRQDADQLAHLVNDLFELSRIHAGAVPLRLAPADLAELAAEAVELAAPAAAAKAVTLRGPEPGAPAAAAVSAPELARVLANLIDNALRHTPAGGEVSVAAERVGAVAVITVADEGGGVPPEHLERIFELGFTGDEARTPRGGAGLGLAIARGLVEAHGGELRVENAGRGARFTIRLPASADADAAAAGAERRTEAPASS